MSKGTDLLYNEVTISSCLTRLFHQEAVYDDSDTDLLYHKFTIKVMGYVFADPGVAPAPPAPAFPPVTPIGPGPTNILPSNQVASGTVASTSNNPSLNVPPSTTISQANLRQQLMEPKNYLLFTVGGEKLLEVLPFDPTLTNDSNIMDMRNGPKPRRCDITQIAGTGSMRVEFEIEACILDCFNSPDNPRFILNNRWYLRDELDENWYTTRTISGKLVIGGIGDPQDPADALNVNAFRSVVVPPLQPGFKRERMSFQSTPDGLTLAYEIQDKEVYASAPIPGMTWQGTYEISSGDGVNSFHSINLHFEGAKNADRAGLIRVMAAIADRKLMLTDSTGRILPGNIPSNIMIVEHMDRNAFDFRATYRLLLGEQSDSSFFGIFNTKKYFIDTSMLGVPLDFQTPIKVTRNGQVYTFDPLPGYDSQVSPTPPVYGTAVLAGLFLCPWQTPCESEECGEDHAPDDEIPIEDPCDDVPEADEINYSTDQNGIPVSPYPEFFPPSNSPSAFTPSVYYTPADDPPDPTVDLVYNQDQLGPGYTTYRIDTHYDAPQMTAMLPIAAPSPYVPGAPTAVFVQLAPAICRRRITLKAEAYGQWPQMPDLTVYTDPAQPFVDSNGITIVLLDVQYLPKSPPVAADGVTPIFNIDAEYLFGLSRAPQQDEPLSTGSLPFLLANLAETAVPTTIYQPGIIE